MSRSIRRNAAPKSLVSVNAVPPVLAASVVSESCDEASEANCCMTPAPENEAASTPASAAAAPAAATAARVAAGHDRLKPARVDGIDRHVRRDRRVDGRAKLDLVVGAAPLHAGAEVDDRLLLFDPLERLGERLDRAQPDVVVEHVQLRSSQRRLLRRPRAPRRSRAWMRPAAASRCLRCRPVG